jgi:hypothetical protein
MGGGDLMSVRGGCMAITMMNALSQIGTVVVLYME